MFCRKDGGGGLVGDGWIMQIMDTLVFHFQD